MSDGSLFIFLESMGYTERLAREYLGDREIEQRLKQCEFCLCSEKYPGIIIFNPDKMLLTISIESGGYDVKKKILCSISLFDRNKIIEAIKMISTINTVIVNSVLY